MRIDAPSSTPALRAILRAEGAAALGLAIAGYASLGYGWLPFALLLFVPDVTMLGYLGGPRVGAAAYNLGHTYLAPVALGTAGWLTDVRPLIAGALIWAAHIGLDRLLGYGLKLHTGFRQTHLGPIGRD